ncbi:MAG TPA: hypothetical protein DCQ06_07685 [Myxococcales bacterium]|mgnify:CR=1 FL=1|nr:hypothetical protein [Myxococcales bacterium]HAN31464.1 hypothetical protein [Myxococcales bacterium]
MAELYPAPLGLQGVSLSGLANEYGFELMGPDGPVKFFGRIKMGREGIEHVLSYVTAPEYLDGFAQSPHEYALIERRFVTESLPSNKSWLICDEMADEWLFKMHIDAVAQGRFHRVSPFVDPSAIVHPSAVVMDNVHLGANTRIDANVVLYPNTFVGEGSHIMANSTLGGEGFETKYVFGERKLIPHTGGVIVESGVTIGSSTCIDCGLFGTFTRVRAGAHIDNLCHIAHNADIGDDAAIVACALVAGSVTVGKGAWWGPGAVSNHEVVVGDYAYIGTGAVLTRDIPAHALAFGAPAKVRGWACRCRNKLNVIDGRATCSKCGAQLISNDQEQLVLVDE